jgi:hypothetical protein
MEKEEVTATMRFKLKDVLPNPYRNLKRYHFDPQKIAQLRESIQSTGFWDNIVARKAENNGKVEIAYGHHRIEALKKEYSSDHKIELIIRDLDDDIMAKMMARENMTEWATNNLIEQETCRAVIEGYAQGKLHLEPPTGQGTIRYAPSFLRPPRTQKTNYPYTAESVAKFIGWHSTRVKTAINALELIEEGTLKESHFEKLGTNATRAVVSVAYKAKSRNRTPEQTASIVQSVARSIKEGKIGYKQAGASALLADWQKSSKKEMPPVDDFAEDLQREFTNFFRNESRTERLQQLITFRDHIDNSVRDDLITAMTTTAHLILKYAAELKPNTKDAKRVTAA